MRPSVAILCGGRGARLQEHTQSIPKPLVQVGGRPILWHVISIHIRQGFSDFLLLTGYRKLMGAFTNQLVTHWLGWLTVTVIIGLNLFLLWQSIA